MLAADSGHDDYVLDAKYDYYGRRFATCSSDHSIRVWDQVPEGGWRVTSRIPKAARAAISRISWSFPEYGQLIAVCSEDGSVQVFEEQTDVGGGLDDRNANASSKWVNRAVLKDSSRAVTDIEFAPRHLGLRLAAACGDGVVRVYEAVDVMNLSHWPLQDSFDAERGAHSLPPSHPPSSAPSGDDLGSATHFHSPAQQLCVSWNSCRFDPPGMVVGGNHSVKVWQYDEGARRWEVVAVLAQEEAVHDVAWAPRMGRSYHVVATAGKDMILRVHYLRYAETGTGGGRPRLTYSPEDSRDLDTKSEVWRVEWNVTGTLLAASGDDGIVKLWAKKPAEQTNGSQQQQQQTQHDWVQVKVISRPLVAPEGADAIVLH